MDRSTMFAWMANITILGKPKELMDTLVFWKINEKQFMTEMMAEDWTSIRNYRMQKWDDHHKGSPNVRFLIGKYAVDYSKFGGTLDRQSSKGYFAVRVLISKSR